MTSQFNFQSLKQKNYYENELLHNKNNDNSYTALNIPQPKTKLTKKYVLKDFKILDLVWIRPSEGRFKYQVLVRYIDPELPKTKRQDGAYQKVVKFGQKGMQDFIDPPHNINLRMRNLNKIKSNTDNPLHANFYYIHLLNGQNTDINQNFNILKKNIFS